MRPLLHCIVVIAGLFAATGCVQVSPRTMPPDWPALSPATPAKLSGIFTGTVDLARTAAIFFAGDEIYAHAQTRVTTLHLAATEQALVVRIVCSDGRTLERAVPVSWEQGAAVLTRRFSGREGANAATYRDTWRFTTNSARELVVEHTQFTTALLFVVPGVGYYRDWLRLRRVR